MRKLLILLTLSIAFAITANAQTNFVGKYTFYEDGGKTAGGTGIGIGHQLEIKSDGTVILNAAGFQTGRRRVAPCNQRVRERAASDTRSTEHSTHATRRRDD